MMIVRPNRTATATYKADSDEVNTNSKVNIVDNKAEYVQSKKMAMQNVLVDCNRCLNGQYTALNLSQDIMAADRYEPNTKMAFIHSEDHNIKAVFCCPKLIDMFNLVSVKGY